MQPRFSWKCSFMGEVEYEVIDATGRYLIATQHAPSDYHLSICNGETARRDTLAKVGLLVRSHNCDRSIPAETVAAFNAWRAAEHVAHMAQLASQPERYGFISADDSLRQAPAVLRGAHYVIGPGWTLDSAEIETAPACRAELEGAL